MLTLLNDLVRRTRQHHAIEHATLHMLAARFPQRSFTALSDPLGFTVAGEMNEYELRRAVGDAMLRLQAGEAHLAIHPNCGTNLAVTGVAVTFMALLGGSGRRSFFERFSTALLFVLPALVYSRPLGYKLQAYTTLPAVADRWVADVYPVQVGAFTLHRVLFD